MFAITDLDGENPMDTSNQTLSDDRADNHPEHQTVAKKSSAGLLMVLALWLLLMAIAGGMIGNWADDRLLDLLQIFADWAGRDSKAYSVAQGMVSSLPLLSVAAILFFVVQYLGTLAEMSKAWEDRDALKGLALTVAIFLGGFLIGLSKTPSTAEADMGLDEAAVSGPLFAMRGRVAYPSRPNAYPTFALLFPKASGHRQGGRGNPGTFAVGTDLDAGQVGFLESLAKALAKCSETEPAEVRIRGFASTSPARENRCEDPEYRMLNLDAAARRAVTVRDELAGAVHRDRTIYQTENWHGYERQRYDRETCLRMSESLGLNDRAADDTPDEEIGLLNQRVEIVVLDPGSCILEAENEPAGAVLRGG